MKTSLLSRLGILCASLVVLPASLALAQTTSYSEAPVIAKSGYWMLETDPKRPDYTVVRFYNDQHEELYQERLSGICLNPLKNRATHRRVAQMLGTALDQVQRMQSNAVISTTLASTARRMPRTYAVK
ncbi:hypothetical protein MUN84_20710 [Hymenobacter sp. 5516J-16]|uniref:Uncharacterized protein n=1 Tax=Hymenobacter sublimis TaxID=2933777 RepID=A0ABY4JCN6_9BACT|nr:MULTISPECIES: hypothetical protein [Hymenobacter]UOQ76882.1 hypothetical protein MUN84_20710 [Hymenobacter sp. 5516J-16]UPL50575.1 hypothetical protein MWH26_06615 [Hymenobacter sublimis]